MEALMSFGIQGPKGDTGPQGPRGATGPQGPAGPSGFKITGTTTITCIEGATGSNILFGFVLRNGTYGAQMTVDIVYRGTVAYFFHNSSDWVYQTTAIPCSQMANLTYVYKMTITSAGYLSFTRLKESASGNFGMHILAAQSS